MIMPLGDQVLVKRDDTEDTSKGGLVLPDTAKQKARCGTVIRTGDGIRIESAVASHVLQEGDRVWFNMLSGNEVEYWGEKHLLIAEREIIAWCKPVDGGFSSVRPMDDRVVIRPDAPPSQSDGGILLPEVAQDKAKEVTMRGTVVSVGLGKRYWDFEVQTIMRTETLAEGERVYYRPYTGSDIVVDGEEFRVVREFDILCVETT